MDIVQRHNSCTNVPSSQTFRSYFIEYYFLGYNAVYSVKSQPTFRRSISPAYSLSYKTRKEMVTRLATCFLVGIFLDLFDPEGGGDKFL
jgi:hypothetical protein